MQGTSGVLYLPLNLSLSGVGVQVRVDTTGEQYLDCCVVESFSLRFCSNIPSFCELQKEGEEEGEEEIVVVEEEVRVEEEDEEEERTEEEMEGEEVTAVGEGSGSLPLS